MVWLLMATLGLILGSRLMLPRHRLRFIIDRWLSVGVLSLAGQVLVLLISGVTLHLLRRPVVLFGSGVWLAMGLLIHVRRRRREPPARQGPTSHPSHAIGQWVTQNQLLLPVGIILTLSIIVLVLSWIYLPPYAWDEIWYHLTPMAAWYQQGAITLLPEAAMWGSYDPTSITPNQLAQDFSVAYNWANVYPLNAELSALWSMVLTGTDQWADAAQLPYVMVGTLATVGLSRVGGASRSSSLLTGMLFVLTPTVLNHLRVAYVDAAFGSMVAASLYLLLRWLQELDPWYAGLLGVSLGLTMGIKSTGVAFVAIFGLGALIEGLSRVHQGKLSWRRLYCQAGLALVALMATGSYWYLRTWLTYGNPIYPVRLQLGRWILPGLGTVNQLFMTHNTPSNYQGRNPLLNLLTSWLELGDETYNYYSRTRGLGPVWAAFALPALLPFVVYAWRRRQAPQLWMVGLTTVLLLIQPAAWWPRYVIYVVPVGLAAMAWVLDRLRPPVRSLVAGVVVINLLVATGLTLVDVADRLPQAMHLPTSQRTFGRLFFSDYAWIDEIPPARIGHTPLSWIYPLYGGLRHQVALTDGASLDAWRQAIVTDQIDYLVVDYHYGPYDQWARSLTDLLTPYREGDRVNVYKVQH